ncbi:MAG: hypothetical protein ACRD06_00895 [Terriglobia bacterium]
MNSTPVNIEYFALGFRGSNADPARAEELAVNVQPVEAVERGKSRGHALNDISLNLLIIDLTVCAVAGGRKLHRYGGRKLHSATWELRDPSWSGPCTRWSIECCYVTTSSRG